MTRETTHTSRRFGLRLSSLARALPAVLALVALAVTNSAKAQTTQTLIIPGGKGNVGAIAKNVEYYNPATGLWQPAYLADKRPQAQGVEHDWGVLAGTDHWINYRSDGSLISDPLATPGNTLWYLYRVRFTVPADAQNATMTFSLKADNRARVAINGVSTGAEIVGQINGVNADAVFSQAVHPGENTITINVGDEGGLNGLNFLITLSVQSVQPLAIVTPALPVNWVNWTGTELASGITRYVGRITVPRVSGGSTAINVKYTPPTQQYGGGWEGRGYWPGICFPQFSGGTDFFAQVNPLGQKVRDPARSPYTSAKVPNIPNGGGASSDMGDIIALQFAGTNTLEFFDASNNQPISIASPVFAYVSLNGNGYGFNQDFDILSFGDGTTRDSGYWGNGTSIKSIVTVNGATQYQLLQGPNPTNFGYPNNEPHGTLQFRGSFNSVTWQSLSNETWNGFTIGVAQLAADVPIANAGLDRSVTQTSPSGASVQLSGSVSGSTNSPFTFNWTGAFGTATGANPTVTLPVGTHTITLTVTDAAGATDSDTVVITILPNPAPVINSPTTATGTYGASFTYTITATNSPTSFGATNLPAGLSISGAVISGVPTQSGIFGVNLSASNSGGTGAGSVLITVNKANATVVVTPYSVTYDGNPHSALFTITGVNGETGAAVGTISHTTTHTNAGSYSDSWSFTGGANYNNIATTAITNTIAKATATVSVSGYTGVYDGAAHGATGTATGVGGTDLSGSLSLGASFTNAPGGTANWTFSGGTNYNDQNGSVAIAIAKANATVVVTPYNVTYDAASHAATVASITGVNGETGAIVGAVTLSTTHTNAGTYSDSWSFAGGTNYSDIATTAITNTIAKANATVSVSGYTGVYDSASHGATGTATGVGGVDLSSGLNLGAAFINAPGGTANWTFSGGTNYADTSGTAAIVINKASATVVVNGYTGVYDGAAHGATGTAKGVGGVSLSGLNLGAMFTNAPGGTANWTFSGGTNYNDTSSTATVVIAKANATVVVTPYNVTYNGQPRSASATIAGVNGETGATVGAVTLTTPHTNAGTYADSWSFAGGVNYNNIPSTAITNTIAKAIATVVVTPYDVEYDGVAHSATVTSITGVNGETGATVGTVALNSTHTAVGTYADSWSFTGTANYNNIVTTPITDKIKDTTAPAITATMTARGGGDDESSQFFTLVFSATDLVGVKTLTAVLNGVTVTNGQVVQLQLAKSGRQESEKDHGKLKIKATSFALVVTAKDAAGNTSTKTIVPVFVKNGKDDDDKKGEDKKGDDKKGEDKKDSDSKGSDDKKGS